jgi:hypothetical protein
MKHLLAVLTGVIMITYCALTTVGCKKESNPETPPPTVEHPPATTVTFYLKDSSGTTILDSCVVRDTSLVHGQPPLVGQLDVTAGTIYRGKFKLVDESQSPPVDLTADVISEKDAHLFRFRYTGADTTRVVVSDRDLDSHGLPFGLNFKVTVTAGGAANGNLHVVLEHHDDGNKAGTVFDLDLDRDFPVAILP